MSQKPNLFEIGDNWKFLNFFKWKKAKLGLYLKTILYLFELNNHMALAIYKIIFIYEVLSVKENKFLLK